MCVCFKQFSFASFQVGGVGGGTSTRANYLSQLEDAILKLSQQTIKLPGVDVGVDCAATIL